MFMDIKMNDSLDLRNRILKMRESNNLSVNNSNSENEGIHSIDVSLTIAPLLHQFIVGRLEAMGLDYDEGINNVAEKEGIRYQRNITKAMKMLSEIKPTDDVDEMDLEQTEVEETAPVEEQTVEEPVRGLMART